MPHRIDDLNNVAEAMIGLMRQALSISDEATFAASLRMHGESLEQTAARLTLCANGLSELAVLMDQAVVRLDRSRLKQMAPAGRV